MGFKLEDIGEGEPITLLLSSNDKSLEMQGLLKKHVRNNIALIGIDYSDDKRLNFDNVQIDLEYAQDSDVPIIWRNAKIVTIKNEYVLQVFSDGVRHNRRGSYRVAVAKTALMRMVGRGSQHVMIKDISITGFAISDRTMELGLTIGDKLSISFEDFGHKIDLDGRVVRIEEREDMIIYGLEIMNLCKDLSSYISTKQRRNRN